MTWNTGFYNVEGCLNGEDKFLIRVGNTSEDKKNIKVLERRTGQTIFKFTSACRHFHCVIIEHPGDPKFMLEACWECGEIRSYNINTGACIITYIACKPRNICKGQGSCSYLSSEEGQILKLQSTKEKGEIELVSRIHTHETSTHKLCYTERHRALVLSSTKYMIGLNPVQGHVLWHFQKDVEGKRLNVNGLCCDRDGRVYVADGGNERLIVLNGKTGKLLVVLLKGERTGPIHDVYWTNFSPQLTVLHGFPCKVSIYNLVEK